MLDASHFQKILIIDTSQRETTNVGLLVNGKLFEIKKQERAQSLQKIIEQVLEKVNSSINEIEAITVIQGDSSITGNRIGGVTANTLAWLKNIPIIKTSQHNYKDVVSDLRSQKELELTTSVDLNE